MHSTPISIHDAAQNLVDQLKTEYPNLQLAVVEKSDTLEAGDGSKPDFMVVVLTDSCEIYDPYRSQCCRFPAEPFKDYGIPDSAARRICAFNNIAVE